MATLIPKIVHFCWLSDNPYPADVRRCMATWREKLPGDTFMHWDFTRFPRGTSKWVDDAFDAGQFAFAADYIRLYALKHYGGIYLDADVEVLKPFDDLLQLPYFIGYESANEGIEAAALGFEKNHPLIEAMLRTYDGQHFIQADGSFHDITLPKRFFACIKQGFNLKEIASIREFDRSEKIVCVLPSDYFSPKNFLTLQVRRTPNTYTIHHFAGSWLSPGRRFYLCCRRGAERLLGSTVMGMLKRVKRWRCG